MLTDRFAHKHLSDLERKRYHRREMRPDELIAASDHLAACAECFQRFHDPRLVEAAYKFAQKTLETTSNDHLLYEQLAGYSDDSLSAAEREAPELHLSACEECEADLQSFLNLSALINRRDQGVPVSTLEPATVRALPTFWEKLRASWRLPSYRSLLPELTYRTFVQATSLVVIVGLIMWGITRSTQKQIKELKSEIAELQAENGSLQAGHSKDQPRTLRQEGCK